MANSYKINKKDKLILKELLENPSGMRAITLKKLTNIKEKTLYNHLQKLKKEKLIENIFPIWRLCQNQIPSSKVAELLQSSKIIQGHKFSFKLDLIRKPNWWEKRGNRLIKLKEYQFKINKEVKWGNNPYQQLKKDNFLIHIFKNSIFFINQKKYFGDDPYLCFQEALLDTLEALRYLEERISPKVEQIHAVVNGTLNYIFDEISKGKSLAEVVEETKKLGYTEPKAESPFEVINKESTEDVLMKSSILFNICFRRFTSKRMKAKNVKSYKIGESELKRLIKESNNRRCIVSIRKEDNEEDIIGGFKYQIDDWIISAGFKNINENPLFLQLVPNGVNNSVLIYEGRHGIDGTYRLSGQGAGARPTTSSMIKDAIKLFKK